LAKVTAVIVSVFMLANNDHGASMMMVPGRNDPNLNTLVAGMNDVRSGTGPGLHPDVQL
jgi:hypothetical protein